MRQWLVVVVVSSLALTSHPAQGAKRHLSRCVGVHVCMYGADLKGSLITAVVSKERVGTPASAAPHLP